MLEYERALQAIDPSVAAHYWKYDAAAPNVFIDDFMGDADTNGEVTAGPFAGWSVGSAGPPIERNTNDHTLASGAVSDATLLMNTTYSAFYDELQGSNSHSRAHGWIGSGGGWMGAVATAAQDPTFFLLHSNVERIYCLWQYTGPYHGTANYDPQGSFVCGTSTERLGAHLDDSMWPWNGLTGEGPCMEEPDLDDRPSSAPGGTLDPPPGTNFMLGPPAMPTVGNVIDYLGRDDPTLGLGYCYDTVPYN